MERIMCCILGDDIVKLIEVLRRRCKSTQSSDTYVSICLGSLWASKDLRFVAEAARRSRQVWTDDHASRAHEYMVHCWLYECQ